MTGPRVAYVVNRFPRWGGGWILNEVRSLLSAGVELAIFSFKRPADEVAAQAGMKEWIDRTVYLPSGTSLACLASAALFSLSSPAGALRGMRAALRLGGRMARGSHILEVLHLARSIRRSGAEHVHAQHADYLADAALAAAEAIGLSFSFAGHAHDLYTTPGRLAEKIRRARFVVTCTGFNADYLETLCSGSGDPDLDRSKIVKVYHGVDLDRFSFRESTGAPSRLVTVTRLKEKKGFPYLLDALAALKRRGVEFTLDVYGDGDQRQAILDRVSELDLSDRIALRGAIEHERIPDALGSAGIFVLPCVVLPDQDRDGIPNTIIEALASGVAVVTTSISGIPEAVRDGETGLLVPERDATALASAIERMMADDGLRERCARGGREVAEKEFSLKATGRALAGLFRKTAETGCSAR